jgi:hypothetical protein
MSTTALAIPESYNGRPSAYGTRAHLTVPNGDIEGYLALAGCDKHAGTASYALRIVNQSENALRARMTCATLRGEVILAYPLDVQIAPFSVSETLLPVRIADVGPFDRAIVQVQGGSIAFSLEAPAPSHATRRPRWIVAVIAALLFTLACACAAALSTPRLALLAAPDRTAAGASIDVPYAFGGWAWLAYALQTHDGRQLSAGLIRDREGTIHFVVPRSAGSDVVLSVNVTGPFGHISTQRSIAIAPSPRRKVAHRLPGAATISAFAIGTPNVRAGQTLRVNYITNARDGEIWLIDEGGQLWAQTAVVPQAGQADINVPASAAGRQMRVVMHARNAGSDAVAAAVVTILPGDVDPQAVAQGGGNSLNLSADHVTSGQIFTVTIGGAYAQASVTLTDGSGNQIQQGDIAPGHDAASLSAPVTAKTAAYYVTATVNQGVAQQTLVRKITVAP